MTPTPWSLLRVQVWRSLEQRVVAAIVVVACTVLLGLAAPAAALCAASDLTSARLAAGGEANRLVAGAEIVVTGRDFHAGWRTWLLGRAGAGGQAHEIEWRVRYLAT
jgi:hypothetical protein